MAPSRLFIIYITVVLLCTLGSAVLIESKIRSELESELKSQLIAKANGLAELVRVPLLLGEHESIAKTVSDAARITASRLTVIAKDGTVVGDSSQDPTTVGNQSQRMEIASAFPGNPGFDTRRIESSGEVYWYCAVALPDGSGYARAADRLGPFVDQVGSTTGLALVGLLLVSAVAVLVGATVSTRLSRRLTDQADVANRIAEGDFSRRVDADDSDGIANVGTALNRLADKLEHRIAEMEARKRGLSLVLDSVADGLVAIGPDDLVTHINPEARVLLDISGDVVGRPFWELIRDGDLPRLVTSVREMNRPVASTLRVGSTPRREIEVRVSPIVVIEGRYDGAVLDFRDVTVLRRLEAVRRDFVANVSHEMKTPLTSIQGYVETLQDGAIDDAEVARSFLAKIERNARSLGHLVTDLLVLSRVESGGLRIDSDPFAAASMVGEAFASVADKAREKGITCRFLGGDRSLLIRGDRDLLVRAVVNLLDNAVHYTASGGSIDVTCEARYDRVEIAVADTGIGIPVIDLERIFERFYRVDKARSRALGGTGLGLAIVKHVAEQHGGTIRVTSTEGVGSTFTLSLPQAPTA